MTAIEVRYPKFGSNQVQKYGISESKKQRYICRNADCQGKTLQLERSYRGCNQGINETIIIMAVNASEIRDYPRESNVNFKKENFVSKINLQYMQTNKKLYEPPFDLVRYEQVESVELDEVWSFVQDKQNQRWFWLAINHDTRQVLAYAFGKRKDEVFRELKSLLEPVGITMFYTDDKTVQRAKPQVYFCEKGCYNRIVF